MSRGLLTDRQLALAQAFFKESTGFFLTGGAVLAGWTLAHRRTDDLDLFTASDDSMRGADAALRRAVETLGGTLEALTTSPDFRRYLVRFAAEHLKVDVVRDRVPQLAAKVEVDGVVMDSPREILVNKLCTLVERSEVRDLIDVMFLERAGLSVEEALPLAAQKDGGATPATIAWLLSSLPIPDVLPVGMRRDEVVTYSVELQQRLARLSQP